MQTTNNLGLKKPGNDDVVNIEDLNSNSDVLDGKFGSSSGHGHTGAAGDGPKIGSGGLAAGAATDTVIGNRTVSDTTAPTGDSGTPTTLFGWMANMIKAITGGASWRTLPGMTIAAIKVILDAATSAGTASTLVKRDASGRAQVAAPSAAADIANKGYVDTAVTGATIPDASLTAQGKVQLSSATNSTSEALAATPKAVKDAYDRGSAGVSAAGTAQTRANATLPKDGSEPMTGQFLEFNNAGGIGRVGAASNHVFLWNPVGNSLLRLYNDGSIRDSADGLVWSSANDGAGSGLDADMLDGKHLSQIQSSPLTAADSSCLDISGQNLNGIGNSGFYMGANMINAPLGTASWYYVQVMRHNNAYTYQRATELNPSGDVALTYERIQNNGSWKEWLPVGGATYVASNTVREQNLTEYNGNQMFPAANRFGVLIHKFIPKYTGEIVISFEAKGYSYYYDPEGDDNDRWEYFPSGLRVWGPATSTFSYYLPYPSTGTTQKSTPFGHLAYFDSRTPIGTTINQDVNQSSMSSIYQMGTHDTNFQTFWATLSVQAGVPLYFFGYGGYNETSSINGAVRQFRVRNFRLYYDIK